MGFRHFNGARELRNVSGIRAKHESADAPEQRELSTHARAQGTSACESDEGSKVAQLAKPRASVNNGAYGSSLNGLKTFSPGRRKSRSFPVAIVKPCRRAVAAM